MKTTSTDTFSRLLPLALALAVTALLHAPARCGGSMPPDDSPMVKLLKSKRVPDDRQGTIVELIGKRGTADDLTYIYQQAIAQEGFPEPVRIKALEALAGAAANRNLKPAGDLEKLVPLVQARFAPPGASVGKPAIRLAGLWKLKAAASALADLARSERADVALRAEAFDALATIGGKAGSAPIEALAAENVPEGTRLLAITALARLDLPGAAARAAEILAEPAEPGRNLVPLRARFSRPAGRVGHTGEGHRTTRRLG